MKNYTLLLLVLLCYSSLLASSLEEQPKECLNFCSLQYEPVCGYNNKCYKLFSNACFMGIENCINNDSFGEVPLSKCSDKCLKQC